MNLPNCSLGILSLCKLVIDPLLNPSFKIEGFLASIIGFLPKLIKFLWFWLFIVFGNICVNFFDKFGW